MIVILALIAISHVVCTIDGWRRDATHVRRIRDRVQASAVDRALRADAGPPVRARSARSRAASASVAPVVAKSP